LLLLRLVRLGIEISMEAGKRSRWKERKGK
jgi:hypothetical protein